MKNFEKIESLISRANTLVDDICYAQRLNTSSQAKTEPLHDRYLEITRDIATLVHNLKVGVNLVVKERKSIVPIRRHLILLMGGLIVGAVIVSGIEISLEPFSFRFLNPTTAWQFLGVSICIIIAMYVGYGFGLKHGRSDILDVLNEKTGPGKDTNKYDLD